ncbi:cobalamin B12-binding domain-containing protein [Clostridium sulfidigenes]|uniref:cobalamin B12-binding domain-containing protein n=1 Tax=Clostridium sulfidigenes TaxID=318464 RepID=UPI003F8C87CB
MNKKKIVLGASIGNCVHVAGVSHFLDLAEREGYGVVYLGPAVSIDSLFEQIKKYKPDIIGISYRLTPENVDLLLKQIDSRRKELSYCPMWCFGGTKPVTQIAQKYEMFAFISDGTDDINDSIRFLRGDKLQGGSESYGKNFRERVNQNYPYPVLRHHFGLPSMEDTINGVEKISEAKVLDIISLGTDQNAQQYFFNQNNMRKEYDGAGGVPIRTKEDLKCLKQATQKGNYPLIRCYSGTEEVFKYAEMLVDTIDNAWTAIPLCWYNELDGRGTRTIENSIVEAQQLIKWHADRDIPVEINEPHHWGLRDAHDVMSVAMAYISAYNAKKLGVKDYIAQYMFNTPSGLTFSMDFAKILAMIEMVESLKGDNFRIYRQTRAGLPLFNPDLDVAKGQLAATTFMQMAIKPHIIHVVAYCEADHAASAEDVIASCRIVKGVIRHTLSDMFSIEKDSEIVKRKEELISEAKVLINFIENRFVNYEDPLANPEVLAESIKRGYIDAVHIVKNSKFRGNLTTKFVDGKCVAYDKETGELLDESTRLKRLLEIENSLLNKIS